MKKLQLVVVYLNNTILYHPVDFAGGWKIDATTNQIVIGTGLPRKYIPLSNVYYYEIEEVRSDGILRGHQGRIQRTRDRMDDDTEIRPSSGGADPTRSRASLTQAAADNPREADRLW